MDLRRLAAAALAAVALVSAAVSAPRTWDHMSEQRDRYGAMSDAEAEDWAATYHELDAAPFEGFARAVGRGDRYYVHTPRGDEIGFFDEAGVARTWAAFRLLPAIQVDDPAHADKIVAYRADPRDLGLEYSSISLVRGGTVAVVRR